MGLTIEQQRDKIRSLRKPIEVKSVKPHKGRKKSKKRDQNYLTYLPKMKLLILLKIEDLN